MAIVNMIIHRNSENKIDTEALLEKLSNIVGFDVLERVVSNCFDRRHLLEKIASESDITEEILIRKLAKKLHWSYLDEVKALDFREIYEPLMISELRHYGIMPLVKGHSVVGYVCCDPSIVPDKYCHIVNQSKTISTWKAISKALDESGKLSVSSRDEDYSQAKKVISLLASEVNKFGGKGLTVCFDEKETLYKFKSADGQIGVGQIDKSVRENLQSFLIAISHSVTKEINLSSKTIYKLRRIGSDFLLLNSYKNDEIMNELKEIKKNEGSALIFDEDKFFAEVLENLLKDYGLNVRVVSNYKNLSDAIKDDTNLVFCSSDYMNGFWREILKLVKNNKDIEPAFVLFTPRKTEDILTDAISAGVDFCISKRGSIRVVRGCIKNLISRIDKRVPDTEQDELLECLNY